MTSSCVLSPRLVGPYLLLSFLSPPRRALLFCSLFFSLSPSVSFVAVGSDHRGCALFICCVVTAAIPIDESGGLAGIHTRKIILNGKQQPYTNNFRWAGLIIIVRPPAPLANTYLSRCRTEY